MILFDGSCIGSSREPDCSPTLFDWSRGRRSAPASAGNTTCEISKACSFCQCLLKIRQIATNVFSLPYALVELSASTTLDQFSNGVLIEERTSQGLDSLTDDAEADLTQVCRPVSATLKIFASWPFSCNYAILISFAIIFHRVAKLLKAYFLKESFPDFTCFSSKFYTASSVNKQMKLALQLKYLRCQMIFKWICSKAGFVGKRMEPVKTLKFWNKTNSWGPFSLHHRFLGKDLSIVRRPKKVFHRLQ